MYGAALSITRSARLNTIPTTALTMNDRYITCGLMYVCARQPCSSTGDGRGCGTGNTVLCNIYYVIYFRRRSVPNPPGNLPKTRTSNEKVKHLDRPRIFRPACAGRQITRCGCSCPQYIRMDLSIPQMPAPRRPDPSDARATAVRLLRCPRRGGLTPQMPSPRRTESSDARATAARVLRCSRHGGPSPQMLVPRRPDSSDQA